MSSKARVEAFLGINIGAFAAGIDKANGLLASFKRGFKTGGLGNLGGLLGAGAIIQGFRSVLSAAQDARNEAKELGITLDKSTASVAAYADRWDQIKESIGEAGVAALGFFTQTGRAIGKALGTGSSDAEVTGIQTNKDDQKQREKDLKANGERIQREIVAAEKELADLRRTNNLAGLPEKERALELQKELGALFEKQSRLVPGSLAAKKNEIEIEKRLGDVREANAKIDNQPKQDPSEMKTRGAFGLSVSEVAGQRPVGRRSERERRAAEIMALESRGKSAESSGRFDLAKSYRNRAQAMARSMGFGETESGVSGAIRRGGSGGAGASMAGVGPSWDDKYGGQIAARNASLNATYGGKFKRPDSFEQSNIEASADQQLIMAAEALKEAAAALETALQQVDPDQPEGDTA